MEQRDVRVGDLDRPADVRGAYARPARRATGDRARDGYGPGGGGAVTGVRPARVGDDRLRRDGEGGRCGGVEGGV